MPRGNRPNLAHASLKSAKTSMWIEAGVRSFCDGERR
jgi:hypothetical protein